MSGFAFQVTCSCTPSCKSGGPNPEDAIFDVRGANQARFLGQVQSGACCQNVCCPDCGCCYDLSVVNGNLVQTDVSSPRLDSIDVASGPTAGGTLITVSGHRLDFGAVVVKIGGNVCTGIVNQSDGSLQCNAPAGDLSFEQEGLCECKVSISSVTGTFQVGETVTQAGKDRHPEVTEVGADYLYLRGGGGSFDLATQFTGDTSGATATLDQFHQVVVGETATGQTSGATGVLTSVANLKPRIHQVTGTFQGGEDAVSSVAQTRITLKTPPLYGVTDVEISNENGQRAAGGKLVGGFTYTP